LKMEHDELVLRILNSRFSILGVLPPLGLRVTP
jgi:hypothetical protein